MRGNLTKRGKASWRLKFDLGADPVTGKRLTQFATVRARKRKPKPNSTSYSIRSTKAAS